MKINSNPEALAQFRLKVESLAQIPDAEFEHTVNIMHEKHLSKGEVILREGQVCRYYYFIHRGCIRGFCLKDGKEVNVNFYFENDIACDFESFREETPSSFYLVAMEDCVVYYTSKQEATSFFLTDASMQMLLFRFFQHLYLEEEEHSNSFKLLSPVERYQYLLDHRPAFLQRIPLIHLASYLGVSRETLNRIRKKL